MSIDLSAVTLGLCKDLDELRKGNITNADARTRAQLAREILRSVHMQLEGMKVIEGKLAKQIEDKK